jgi:transcriptional regulator
MYHLPYFTEKNEAVVKEFMKQHPFATVIGQSSTYPVATQIPLLIEEADGKLFFKGHIMRQTDHHKAFVQNPQVLCLFTSGHSYVSASWYTNPQTASTWNYMTVHAKGVLEFLGEEDLLDILEKTTAHFENDPNSPGSFHYLPSDYIAKLSKAIVAFRIEVKELDHVFKLSQNRDEKSYRNIIQHLEKRDLEAQIIAEEMKKREESLFNQQQAGQD